jgi:hypothetical protein
MIRTARVHITEGRAVGVRRKRRIDHARLEKAASKTGFAQFRVGIAREEQTPCPNRAALRVLNVALVVVVVVTLFGVATRALGEGIARVRAEVLFGLGFDAAGVRAVLGAVGRGGAGFEAT